MMANNRAKTAHTANCRLRTDQRFGVSRNDIARRQNRQTNNSSYHCTSSAQFDRFERTRSPMSINPGEFRGSIWLPRQCKVHGAQARGVGRYRQEQAKTEIERLSIGRSFHLKSHTRGRANRRRGRPFLVDSGGGSAPHRKIQPYPAESAGDHHAGKVANL